jgi:hypothetical protein
MSMFNGRLRPFDNLRDGFLFCVVVAVFVAFSYAVGAGWWPPVGGFLVAIVMGFIARGRREKADPGSTQAPLPSNRDE